MLDSCSFSYRQGLPVVRYFGSDRIRFVSEVSQTRSKGLCGAIAEQKTKFKQLKGKHRNATQTLFL